MSGGEQAEVGSDFVLSSHPCSSAAVAASHQVSEFAFDLGPGLSIVVTPFRVLGFGAGFCQEGFVAAHLDGPPLSCGGAVGPERAGRTGRFEAGDAIARVVPSDRDFLAGGASDGVGVEIDVELLFALTPAGSDRRLGLAARVDTGSG